MMAQILQQVVKDKNTLVKAVIQILRNASKEEGNQAQLTSLEQEKAAIQQKKERLLEMSLNETISMEEFKQWNDQYNTQLQKLQTQEAMLQEESQKKRLTSQNLAKIKRALEEELSFQGERNHALVGKISDRIVVKKKSTQEVIWLDVQLRNGIFC